MQSRHFNVCGKYVAPETIKRSARTNHVAVRRKGKTASRVCGVNMSWPKTMLAKGTNRLLEFRELVSRKRFPRLIVSRCEVSHQSLDANVGESFQPLAELGNVAGLHTETAHPRVDLDANVGHDAGLRRGATEQIHHFEPIGNRSQILFQTQRFLSLPEATQAQNGLGNACVAQLLTFFR